MTLETYLIAVAITTWIAGNGVLVLLYTDITKEIMDVSHDVGIFIVGHLYWFTISVIGAGIGKCLLVEIIKPTIKKLNQ